MLSRTQLRDTAQGRHGTCLGWNAGVPAVSTIRVASIGRSLITSLAIVASLGCQADPLGADGGSTPVDGAIPGADAAPACTPRVTGVLPNGFHETRYDYIQGNLGCRGSTCHNGTMGPRFTVAGAVYDTQGIGGYPVGGVNVYVVDSAGRDFHMVTAANGAFWLQEEVVPPLRTYVSMCPDRIEMVASANGNCNGGGACHLEQNKIFVNSAR